MKTSLGIWAFGPMVTRFVPGGVTGHASSPHVETTTSAQSTASLSSLRGTWSEASIPISRNASNTIGCGASPGSLPAERA